MKQSELLPFLLMKRLLEPIRERGTERAGAPLAGLIGESGFTGAEAGDKGSDLLLRLELLP
jgi:hypothetical protein